MHTPLKILPLFSDKLLDNFRYNGLSRLVPGETSSHGAELKGSRWPAILEALPPIKKFQELLFVWPQWSYQNHGGSGI